MIHQFPARLTNAIHHGFIGSLPVLLVETGDVITLAAGMAIVILVAVLANPQSLSGLQSLPLISPQATPSPAPLTSSPTLIPVQIVTTSAPKVTTPTPQPTIAPPYRIFYTDKPLAYPVFTFPSNMVSFGTSDVYLQNEEIVTFAYINDTRGGLTQKFSIPYPLWIMNATVTAEQNPVSADFRMVLCYANNGTIISGMEIQGQGSEIRVVETTNVNLYMIISTSDIDKYRIELMTPKRYYNS
jgi:hypothetical protein